jgi:hypothetical protein
LEDYRRFDNIEAIVTQNTKFWIYGFAIPLTTHIFIGCQFASVTDVTTDSGYKPGTSLIFPDRVVEKVTYKLLGDADITPKRS